MSISKHTISSSITKHVDIQCETIRVFVLCVRETDTTCTDVYRNKQTAISCFCGANHRVCETFSFDRKFLSFVHVNAFNFNRNCSWVSTFCPSLFHALSLALREQVNEQTQWIKWLLLSFTRRLNWNRFAYYHSLSLSLSLAPRLLILLLVTIEDDLANVHTRVFFSCVFCYCLDLCRRHFHSQDNIISRTKLPKVCACVVCI